MMNEADLSVKILDLSYNDLSEDSIAKCYELYKEKGIAIDLSHNRITLSSLSHEHKNFVQQCISQNVLEIMQSHSIAVINSSIEPLSIQIATKELSDKLAETSRWLSRELAETNRGLSNQIAEADRVLSAKIAETDRMLSSKIEKLTDAIASLSSSTKKHESLFTKMFKDLEEKIVLYVINSYVGLNDTRFRKLTPEENKLLQQVPDCPEFDGLLLSIDSTTLIVCEVKHTLKDEAFAQLRTRKAFLEQILEDCKDPSTTIPDMNWLANVSRIQLLVGCEIFSDSQLNRAKKLKCIFVSPSNDKWSHVDYSL